MPDWSSLYGTMRSDTAGDNLAASTGTTVTGGAINTKGSYTELVAATTFETNGLAVKATNGAISDYLLDIAVGAASSEVVLVENLLLSAGKANTGISYYIPVQIRAGERIAARCQSLGGASQVMYVSLSLFGPGLAASPGLERVITYGANTADSGGTGIDPGAVAHTKGAYTEITASTSVPMRQLMVVIGSRANSAMSDAKWLVDLAIGTGGSEQVLLPNMQCGSNIQGDTVLPAVHGPYPVNIPAGTRLAARCQCDITDATDRLLDVVVYGVS